MSSIAQGTGGSSKMAWVGWIMGGLPALMILMAGGMNLAQPEFVVKGAVEMGYPKESILGMGLAALASALLYLWPRTAVLGAILLTGYLGGAVATHVRVGDPWGNILTPVVVGALLWGGLYLRDARLRELVPWRR